VTMGAIRYALGRTVQSADVAIFEAGDFAEFVETALQQGAGATTKDGPYFCAPMRGGKRAKENAEPLGVLALDFDALRSEAELLALMDAARAWQSFGYSTASHDPANNKFKARLLFALDRPATDAEYPRLARAVTGELARRSGLALDADSACMKLEQPIYTPRAGALTWENLERPPITVDKAAARVNGAETAPQGTRDETTDEELRAAFAARAGRVQAAQKLAARYVGRGMAPDDAEAALLALLDASGEPDAQKRARLEREIRHSVATAARKFSDPRAPVEELQVPSDLPPTPPISVYESADQPHDRGTDAQDAASFDPPVDIFSSIAAPAFCAEDVPPIIGNFACGFAEAAGFDTTATIVPAVVAAASMVSDHIRIELSAGSRWYESARLWAVTIGGPASGKTPAQREMLQPVYILHRELFGAWVAATKDMDETERPPRPALYTNDATTEKLADILQGNPRGLLSIFEEFESWLGSHDAYRSGQGSRDRGEWLRLFDGGPHQVDRVRRGSFFVENWSTSIISSTTPGALRKLAKHLPNDGLMPRFICAVVKPRQQRDGSKLLYDLKTARAAYAARLTALHGYETGGTNATVRLSPEAQRAFDAEERRLITLCDATDALSESLAAHVGKHPAMIGRLALTFHAATCAAEPWKSEIPEGTMQLAIGFARKAFRHALAVYGAVLGKARGLDLTRALARSVLAAGLTSFNRRELSHACRAFRGAEPLEQEAGLKALEDCGWIAPAGRERYGHGGRWHVNPAVHERFEAEATSARERRAVVRASLLAGSSAEAGN